MCLQSQDICNLLGLSVYCLRSILVICFFHTNNPTVQVEVWSDTLCLFCISTFCGAPLLSTATIFAYGRPFATLPLANQWHFTFVDADFSLFCNYICLFVVIFIFIPLGTPCATPLVPFFFWFFPLVAHFITFMLCLPLPLQNLFSFFVIRFLCRSLACQFGILMCSCNHALLSFWFLLVCSSCLLSLSLSCRPVVTF